MDHYKRKKQTNKTKNTETSFEKNVENIIQLKKKDVTSFIVYPLQVNVNFWQYQGEVFLSTPSQSNSFCYVVYSEIKNIFQYLM